MRLFSLVLSVPVLGFVASCSAPDALSGGGGGGGGVVDGADGADGIVPGTLTAGAWDDNLNFDHFAAWFATQGELAGVPRLSAEEQAAAADRFAVRAPKRRLDVAVVVDVTGSMGDELDYVKAELTAIAGEIDAAWPDAEVRWALVSYLDDGDAYVTRVEDFTTLGEVREALSSTSLGDGGDYPESVEDALEEIVELSWRDGDEVARLAFWIADAPHHEGDEGRVTAALRAAAAADVHLYPVAASGADALTEATMRAGAQLTGGRFLFLTDDSGVGGAHREPTIPCYFVTTLVDAVVRMVDIELSGVWREPTEDELLRTGGDPEDGRCVLDDGDEVQIF